MSWFNTTHVDETEKLKALQLEKDCSQTLASKIEVIRHDHTNPLIAVGESFDNSVGWGEAPELTVDISQNSFKVVDKGNGFESVKRLDESLLFGKKNCKLTESHGEVFKGKFGMGLPTGSIIVGDKITIITMIDGVIHTCIADWALMKTKNTCIPITRKSTDEEIGEFNSYYGCGTLIKYENLINVQVLQPKKIHDYVKTLYNQISLDKPLPKISIMQDHTLCDFGPRFENPIVNYLNNCDSGSDKHYIIDGYLIKKDDGKFAVVFRNDGGNYNYNYLKDTTYKTKYPEIQYKIKVSINAMNDMYLVNSGLIDTPNDNLIGFKITRNGRNVTTHKARKLGSIDTSNCPYRSKGLRINLEFIDDNTNTDLFDADFTISSLKDINEASYHYWKPSLQESLNQIGQRATSNYSSRKLSEKDAADYKLKKIFSNIEQNSLKFTEEETVSNIKIIDRLKNDKKYSSDYDNSDIPPFKYDGRNGMFKKFIAETYSILKTKLDKRKLMLETPTNYCDICNEVKSVCGCCEQCKKTSDECDCCKSCNKTSDKCACCKKCKKKLDDCDCCKSCKTIISKCICCKICSKSLDNCECSEVEECEICSKSLEDCECSEVEECEICSKSLEDCECSETNDFEDKLEFIFMKSREFQVYVDKIKENKNNDLIDTLYNLLQ